jgi:hypothetical protein
MIAMQEVQGMPENLLTFIGLILAAIGLLFTGIQINQNTKLQRARFITDVLEMYLNDKEIRKAFYQIDYGRFHFDSDKFILSEEEQWVDHLLFTLDLIGRIVDLGALNAKELDALTFEILRIMDNPEIRKYLEWLASEYKGRTHVSPYHNAQKLADQLRKRVRAYKY